MTVYQILETKEKDKKKIQRLFKDNDLEITAGSNVKVLNYYYYCFRPNYKPDDKKKS